MADIDLIRAELRADVEAVVAALLGEPNRALSSRREWRWGNKGSLAVELAGDKRGLWVDHSSGEGGDLLALIQRESGGDFRAAVGWAERFVGADPSDRPAPRQRIEPPPSPETEHATLSPWGSRLWDGAHPITADCAAGRYLTGRGCALPEPHAVRYVPSLPYGRGGAEYPALLGLVTDIHDAAVSLNLHRTWLQPDGSGKAPVDRPRLLLKGHRKAGGVIRLSADDEVTLGLGIAEGLETSLTVPAGGWAPVWCAIDAGNVGNFPVLPGIEALTIFADHDEAGLRGADKGASRWREAGREARVITPPTAGNDINDWKVAHAG